MSFQEAVIIPMSLFQKCNFDKTKKESKSSELLTSNLQTPIKMKLFEHERVMEKRKRELLPHSPIYEKTDEDWLIQGISEKFRPYAKSILEFIKLHPDELGYDNSNYEIRINDDFIRNSNLGKILQFLMKSAIVTREEDIPLGTYSLLTKLYDLGMPKTWVKVKILVRRSSRIPPKTVEQQWLNWK